MKTVLVNYETKAAESVDAHVQWETTTEEGQPQPWEVRAKAG